MQPPKIPVSNEKLSQLMDGEWYELNPSDCVKGVCADEQLRGKWSRYHLIRDVMKNEPVQVDEQLVSRICAAIDDEPVYSNVTVFAGAADTSAESALDSDNDIDSVFSMDSAASVVSGTVDESGAKAANATIDATIDAASVHSDIAADSNAQTQAREVLVDEARAGNERQKSPGLFGTGVAGFALAASVALVTVVGMNLWQSQQAPLGGVTDSTVALDAEVMNEGTIVVADADINGADAENAFSQQVQGIPLPVVEFVANSGSYWVSPDTAERVDHEMRLNMFLSQHLENSPTSSREGLLPYSRLVGYDERSLER